MAERILKIWGLVPQNHIIDTVTWDDEADTVTYDTGGFRDQYERTAARVDGSNRTTFEALAGWSNGYIGIYPPGEEPWTVRMAHVDLPRAT